MNDDIAIITYVSGEPYLSESKNLAALCKMANINHHRYNKEWLSHTDFYRENKQLLDKKKSGYCAWKPFVILDALKKYKKVLYLDSSMLFIPDTIEEYFKKKDIILSTDTPLVNYEHTKRKTFEIMDCMSDRYFNTTQVWAGTILATREAEEFLGEWLEYCIIEDCISDSFDKQEEPQVTYVLYDQSIYSTLYEKYGLHKQRNMEDGKFWFVDTREYSHRETIEKVFGSQLIKRQDYLIFQYVKDYITNGSCCYNPMLL